MIIKMAACKGVATADKSILLPSAKRIVSPPQRPFEKRRLDDQEQALVVSAAMEEDIDVDLREVYFLIMHFLSGGPCTRASGQLWNELLQHKLLPRRYHAWYSRTGVPSGDENDDGSSFPLSYIQVVEKHPNIEKNHLVKLLRQQLISSRRLAAGLELPSSRIPTAADVPTLLGLSSFSLLDSEHTRGKERIPQWLLQLRWPHWQSDQVHGLTLRELGGGFARHHHSPSIRAASYAIAKPSILVDRIQIIKKFRGHRNAVYCAIFDRSGQHIITGSDDRLVKIWSTETGFCLRSCRGHEGDITDLSVSSGNVLVASASNDFTIRVWRLPHGVPVSVLRGHTGAVTAIAFSPRQSCEHHLLSSSDDGTCRIWDARDSSVKSRVYMPKPEASNTSSKSLVPVQSIAPAGIQISCCAFNADGSIFVTGSSDRLARVWDARKWNDEITGRPNHELDVLKGHENAVNYVQFSGCAGPVKPIAVENAKEECPTKFKNSRPAHDSIVTCSRDGSAIIWIHKSHRKDGRSGHWAKAYHLRVPPPPMPPQPPRGGGPRQRLLPTPRGVNMIVWSLDNRFVLAAIMDCRICVWNAVDGSLVHSLTGHTKSTYVLDVHPFNPRIAMSAGYDGRVIIWDIWEGCPVRTYETGDFEIVDGSFSPDGTSIVVSDEVGQIYLLATGQGESQKDAKYDQFFLGDFRPLICDIQGNVLDQETQLPPHQRNIRDLLCDANMIPYPEPYQSMYQQRRLGALGIDWQPPPVNFAIGTMDDFNYAGFGDNSLALHPVIQGSPSDTQMDGAMRWVEQPTDADETMDWEQDVTRLSDDSESDYSVSEESLSLLDDEQTASSTEGIAHTDEEVDSKEESLQETHLRRSNRNKRKAEGMASSSHAFRRKVVASQDTDEFSADVTDRRLTRQRQAKDSLLYLPAMTPGLQQQSVRPKRVAAKNALQFFSHINTNEEEEDDEMSSSQHDTSSYSTEREPELDGPPISPSPSSRKTVAENVDIHGGEETDKLATEEKVESPESNEKVRNFDIDEIVDISENQQTEEIDQKQEYSEKDMKDEDSEADAKEEILFKHEVGGNYEKDDLEETFKNNAQEEICEREMAARLDISEMGEFSRRPRSQRRLVLKLRTGGGDTVQSKCRDGVDVQAGPSSAGEHLASKGDQSSGLRDHRPRSSGRLIVRTHHCVIDTGDNDHDYNASADGTVMTYLDEVRSAGDRGRLPMNGKRKCQPILLQVPKRPRDEHAAGTTEPSDLSPSSLSCSSDKSPSNSEAFHDASRSSRKVLESTFPDVGSKFTIFDREVYSRGIKDLSGAGNIKALPGCVIQEARKTRNSGKQLLEKQVQRQSSPDSAAWFQGEKNLKDDRQIISSSAINTRQKQMESGMNPGISFGQTAETGGMAAEARHREQAVEKVIPAQVYGLRDQNGATGSANYINHAVRVVKGRRSSVQNIEKMDYHSGSNNLQIQIPDNSLKRAIDTRGELNQNGAYEGFQINQKSSNGASQGHLRNRGDASQDLSERNSESGILQESWSESQSEEERGYAQSLRHKRRTLGELESTNNDLMSSEDFMHKGRVRHMRSVMSEAGRETKLKGIREGRGPLNKGKVTPDKSGSRKRFTWTEPVSWNERYEGQRRRQQIGRHGNFTEDGSRKNSDKAHTEPNRLRGIDLQRFRQDGASTPNEHKGIRVSHRARRERTRRDISGDGDQGIQSEMIPSRRDKGARTRKNASWLLLSEVEEGARYIPQFGDEVAYVRQGHQEFLELHKVNEPGPWVIYDNSLRAVESCRVAELDYAILDSGDTCCNLTLEFSDCNSHFRGKTFWLSLPELTDFPDFLVEKSRYDAAIDRSWTHRDRCKVWWRSADGQGGEWWEGRVIAVKPKSSDFPDSPWDRFIVQYKTDTSKPLSHSPWELFDSKNGKWEPPHIDEDRRARLLSMLESAAIEPEDAYGLHRLKQMAGRADFINRVPLPLTFDIIKQRLENNYYRSVRAFYFDVKLLISNAEKYFGSDSDMVKKQQRFIRYIMEEFSPCESPA